MDYSILVGIHFVKGSSEPENEERDKGKQKETEKLLQKVTEELHAGPRREATSDFVLLSVDGSY
jgi:hypothetical protein